MLDIIKAHAVNNLCYISAQKMTPMGIVVHSTGANNPYLKRYVDAPDEVGTNRYGNHWNVEKPGGMKVCVHAFIGYDKNNQIRVAELLPHDICCWGVGKGKNGSFNYDPAYIQFEICEDKLADRSYYEKVFAVAAEYCAELCRTYGISVDKVVGHCEAYRMGYGSNHADPEHWMKNFGQTMDDFRKQVFELIYGNQIEEESTGDIDTLTVSLCDGDLVSIADNATYYNGKVIPAWVKAQNWYVRGAPSGDRVVIDKNEMQTNAIFSPISTKYLTVVKPAMREGEAQDCFCPYLVKVTASSLNIRKSPDVSAQRVGGITDKGVYTIVDEAQGKGATLWGKLKSGVGWISLDYVKKL